MNEHRQDPELSKEDAPLIARDLERTFGWEEGTLPTPVPGQNQDQNTDQEQGGVEQALQDTAWADLEGHLAQLLTDLIDRDFERLLWILYRVDVDESRVRRMLAADTPEAAPRILARLLLERMASKAETRRRWAAEHPYQDEEEDEEEGEEEGQEEGE